MQVTLKRVPTMYLLESEDQKTIPVYTDYEFPSVASNFGWVPCAKCRNTDGTIDCDHRTTSDMISEARSVLEANIGQSFEDPGYFDMESGDY